MRTTIRTLALPAAVAAAAAALLGWMGLLTPAFTDYEAEAEPALNALRAGHVGRFLDMAPAYGGSLAERAPFALAPNLWGGGGDAVFRLLAVPCLLAGVLLGLHLYRTALPLGRAAAWGALLLAAANPITVRALDIGHPEEILIAVLAIAAALTAARGKAIVAGALLGLAVAGKPWAALAAIPVLAMLPDVRAIAKAIAAAAIAGAAVLGPFLLAGATAVHGAAGGGGAIFQPWQVFWFAGEHGHTVMGLYGPKPDYRAAPDWVAQVSHPGVVLAGLAVALLAAALQRRRQAPWTDGLLALAAVLLLRCLLDTWNTSYYALPFLLALLSWEVYEGKGWPKLSFAASALTWFSFVTLAGASPDAQSLFYLAWAVPLAGALTFRAVAGRWPVARPAPRASRSRRAAA